MDVTILAVGTELLFGQTVNTNASYLSKQLNDRGFNVMYHHVVGDNPNRLKRLLIHSLEDTDLVILTGGLGPTQDDLTKETVAEVFGRELLFDEECYRLLVEHFEQRGRKMAENNKKQAYIPEGATVFHNDAGTAPAFAIEADGKCAICLPGPPREVYWLFDHGVSDYLKRFHEKEMVYKVIRTIGIGESDLEMVLMPLIDGQVDPTIATYAKEGECTLRVASQRDTREEAEEAVDAMIREIDKLIGEYIYSYEDTPLNEVVVHLLQKYSLNLTSAESATGGAFAKSVTDVPGASEIFTYGFVTYSAEAKEEILDVPEDIISKLGVVSKEVALTMAAGALERAGADIAVAVTGCAGPTADPGREPGEAYIAWMTGGRLPSTSSCIHIETKRNERRWNRNYFCLRMLSSVYRVILNVEKEGLLPIQG